MTTQSQIQESPTALSRYFPLLLILFAGSGCSALIYEIVWYQLLQLAIGSTAVSLGFLLATYMGGLCIGSIALPRLRTSQHPLRIYAFLEFGIAAFGILVLFGLPVVNRIYVAGAGSGLPGMLLRGFISGVCMLPPTILMGASLPAIVRWVKSTPRGVARWGLLYGGNTVGAVLGCLLAGFYLLRIYDTATGTYVAAAINIAVALVSLAMAARTPMAASDGDAEAAPAARAAEQESRWPVYVTIGLSGACALGSEVVWTRLLGMMLGSTVYVFAIILAVFLTGLAIGSAAGSWILRSVRARPALGWCQILLTFCFAWAAWMISSSLPFWPVNPFLSTSPWYTFQLDLVRCLWAILPPAVLWGASFPLAFAAVASEDGDPGRLVGSVYAANTFGAIVGALSVSLVLVPWIGTRDAQRVVLIATAVSGLFVLIPDVRRTASKLAVIALAASMVAACLLAWSIQQVPTELIAYGRQMAVLGGNAHFMYVGEGRNSSLAIGQWTDGMVEIDVNGHVEATTAIYDMKLQRMVGHLPGILHPNPRSVLGIGFGAGVSAGTFTRYPTIEHITVCEIEPLIPPASTKYFATQNYEVKNNPRTRIVYDDARHYLMTTQDKYDIIASDPLDVFVKGTAALYSKEYFDAVKQRLNPGGMFTLYVPLYESDLKTVKSELATFFEAFPNSTVWANTRGGQGYDMVFMGKLDAGPINLDEVAARLARPDYAPVVESLRDIGVGSALELFATYAGRNADLGNWVQGAEINRDRDLRLQYLAGWGINSSLQDYIYQEMMRFRRRPEGMFSGSPERVAEVLQQAGLGF